MAIVKDIPVDDAEYLIWAPGSLREFTGTGRWEVNYTCAFEDEDGWWRFEYAEGATEMQDLDEWGRFPTYNSEHETVTVEKVVWVPLTYKGLHPAEGVGTITHATQIEQQTLRK